MTILVALPAHGRLRDGVLDLPERAGFPASAFHGAGSRAASPGIDFIEMRPRDAGRGWPPPAGLPARSSRPTSSSRTAWNISETRRWAPPART